MKILYALSFMHGGMAQVWAGNETTAVIDGTSQMHTLDEFLVHVKRTFGDPDWASVMNEKICLLSSIFCLKLK